MSETNGGMGTLADNINIIAKDAERDALNARKRWMDACHADDMVLAIKLRTEAEALQTFARRLTDALGPLIHTVPEQSSPVDTPDRVFVSKVCALASRAGLRYPSGAHASDTDDFPSILTRHLPELRTLLVDAPSPIILTVQEQASDKPPLCPSCRNPEKHHAAAWLCGDKFHHGAGASPSNGSVNLGELNRAKRRALAIFDRWLRVTGAIPEGSSWVWEAEGCIEDAVEIGVQAAFGIHKPLESEEAQ